jgi:hypothetical protein
MSLYRHYPTKRYGKHLYPAILHGVVAIPG